MTLPLNALAATSALVNSLGISDQTAMPAHPQEHGPAMLALRLAQVELYCAHDSAAMHALRQARASLQQEAPAGALASIDEASWHIRKHETREAQRAIARSRVLLS